jgi:hypothetical protein
MLEVVLQVVLHAREVVLRTTKPVDGLPETGLFQAVFAEREKGFEPSTSTLARLHSTTELLPQTSEGGH